MAKDIETAKADLACIVPHMRVAAEDARRRAKPGSTVKFAIIAENPDGGGQVGASFECEEFLADLETVFPPSDEGRRKAEAHCFFSKVVPIARGPR